MIHPLASIPYTPIYPFTKHLFPRRLTSIILDLVIPPTSPAESSTLPLSRHTHEAHMISASGPYRPTDPSARSVHTGRPTSQIFRRKSSTFAKIASKTPSPFRSQTSDSHTNTFPTGLSDRSTSSQCEHPLSSRFSLRVPGHWHRPQIPRRINTFHPLNPLRRHTHGSFVWPIHSIRPTDHPHTHPPAYLSIHPPEKLDFRQIGHQITLAVLLPDVRSGR